MNFELFELHSPMFLNRTRSTSNGSAKGGLDWSQNVSEWVMLNIANSKTGEPVLEGNIVLVGVTLGVTRKL